MIAFLIGFVIGFVIAIPPGAIAVTVVSAVMRRGLRNGLIIGGGAALMDAVYAGTALFGLDLVSIPHSDVVFKFTPPQYG